MLPATLTRDQLHGGVMSSSAATHAGRSIMVIMSALILTAATAVLGYAGSSVPLNWGSPNIAYAGNALVATSHRQHVTNGWLQSNDGRPYYFQGIAANQFGGGCGRYTADTTGYATFNGAVCNTGTNSYTDAQYKICRNIPLQPDPCSSWSGWMHL